MRGEFFVREASPLFTWSNNLGVLLGYFFLKERLIAIEGFRETTPL
jgi:hypothetical protein